MRTAESWRAVLNGIPTPCLKTALATRGLAAPVREAIRGELLRRSAEPAAGEKVRNLLAEVSER